MLLLEELSPAFLLLFLLPTSRGSSLLRFEEHEWKERKVNVKIALQSVFTLRLETTVTEFKTSKYVVSCNITILIKSIVQYNLTRSLLKEALRRHV